MLHSAYEEDPCCSAFGYGVCRPGVRRYASPSPPSSSRSPQGSLVFRFSRPRKPELGWPTARFGPVLPNQDMPSSIPQSLFPSLYLGSVTSGTTALAILVLHSCHEEIFSSGAPGAGLCRSCLRLAQKAAQRPTCGRASEGVSSKESEPEASPAAQGAEAQDFVTNPAERFSQ